MENNEIFVPLLVWLIGGSRIGGGYNYYTASRGTDPMEGFLGKRIFNYRVWIDKLDEQEILKLKLPHMKWKKRVARLSGIGWKKNTSLF